MIDPLPWLGTVVCTRPFTVDDAIELQKLIKGALPGCRADVYWTRGDKVFVRVETSEGVIERALDVV